MEAEEGEKGEAVFAVQSPLRLIPVPLAPVPLAPDPLAPDPMPPQTGGGDSLKKDTLNDALVKPKRFRRIRKIPSECKIC